MSDEHQISTVKTKKVSKFAKFKTPLHIGSDSELWLLVSLENDKQSGENLTAFFDLIERLATNGREIKKIKIILSDYLNRHYRGEEKAKEMGLEWVTKNDLILKACKIPIEIIYWKSLYDPEEVKQKEVVLKKLHQENQEYQIIINGIASSHAKKAGNGSATNYLIEESAVISSLEGIICYPADELNEALKFSIKYFKQNLVYHGYAIYDNNKKKKNIGLSSSNTTQTISKTSNSSERLLICSLQLVEAMENNGIFGAQQQAGFFQKFIELKNQHSLVVKKDLNEDNHGEEINTATKTSPTLKIGAFTGVV